MKKKRRERRERSGFSLIEAMIALGLMAAGMTAMMKITDNQSQNNNRVLFSSEFTRLGNELQILMENGSACRQSLVGSPGSSIDLTQFEANLNEIVNESGDVFISENVNYSNGRLLEIKAIEQEPLASGGLPAGDGEYGFKFKITVGPRAGVKGTLKRQTKVFDFPVYLKVTGGQITDCLTPMEVMLAEVKREACESIGGHYGVIDSDRPDIWCALAGKNPLTSRDSSTWGNPNNNAFTTPSELNPSYNALALPMDGASQNFAPWNLKNRYLARERPENTAAHSYGGEFIFEEFEGTAGIKINDVPDYPDLVNDVGEYRNFEKNVVNFHWITRPSNQYGIQFLKLIRTSLTDNTYQHCNINDIVVFKDQGGIECYSSNAFKCMPTDDGIPQYLQGFNGNGTPVCVPVIAGHINCPCGGNLMNNESGSITFQCIDQNSCPEDDGDAPSQYTQWRCAKTRGGSWTNLHLACTAQQASSDTALCSGNAANAPWGTTACCSVGPPLGGPATACGPQFDPGNFGSCEQGSQCTAQEGCTGGTCNLSGGTTTGSCHGEVNGCIAWLGCGGGRHHCLGLCNISGNTCEESSDSGQTCFEANCAIASNESQCNTMSDHVVGQCSWEEETVGVCECPNNEPSGSWSLLSQAPCIELEVDQCYQVDLYQCRGTGGEPLDTSECPSTPSGAQPGDYWISSNLPLSCPTGQGFSCGKYGHSITCPNGSGGNHQNECIMRQ